MQEFLKVTKNEYDELYNFNQLYEYYVGLKYPVAKIDDFSFNYIKDMKLHSVIFDKLTKLTTEKEIGPVITQQQINLRQTSINNGIALNALDGVPPSEDDLLIYTEYIQGLLTFEQMEEKLIQKYRR